MGCCDNGCFSHVSVLCLGWEFGASRRVCECTVPCFSYLRAPGMVRTEVCCRSCSKVSPPGDANVPLDIQWMSNLYVCSFAFGQYQSTPLETAMANMPDRTAVSPPPVQKVTKTLKPKDIPGIGKGVTSPMS